VVSTQSTTRYIVNIFFFFFFFVTFLNNIFIIFFSIFKYTISYYHCLGSKVKICGFFGDCWLLVGWLIDWLVGWCCCCVVGWFVIQIINKLHFSPKVALFQ
jgi:hypothetical protein